MRLTKQLRRAIVEAVVRDLPSQGYSDRIKERMLRAAVDSLPPAVRALWMDLRTRPYVNTSFEWWDNFGCKVPCAEDEDIKYPPAVEGELEELRLKHIEERDQHAALKYNLTAVVRSVNTTERLLTLLPDFAKYIPKDPDKAVNLPTVTGVVDAFKAAGWPK